MPDPRDPPPEPSAPQGVPPPTDSPANAEALVTHRQEPSPDRVPGDRPDQGLAAEAPLQEIATAFRMNAEALHTLKQMQGDLARQMKRGDRSELVLQSTQSLNETFRNLTSVQQELLRRLHAGEAKSGGGPLIPVMLLGLLVVFLGGIWIVLDEVQRQRRGIDPEMAPAEVVRREREAFKDGRQQGGEHAENEVRRLQEAVDEAKTRGRVLQAEIDTRTSRITELDQAKRTAELERDDFASKVRRAQGEMMAKRVLEEEVGSLRLQLDAANRVALQAEHDRNLQRRKNAYLRERMADRGMGFRDDDPPWRPDRAAGEPPDGMNAVGSNPAADKPSNIMLAKRKRDALAGRGPGAAGEGSMGSASDDRVPNRARLNQDVPMDVRAASSVPAPPYTEAPSAPKPRRGAAYGGDRPGALPPPSLRGGDTVDANVTSVERVRRHLNGLLRGGDAATGAGWRVQSVKQVTADYLGGVVMVRTDAGGRTVERVEARRVGIAVDRSRRQVEFAFQEGLRRVAGQSMKLPTAGSRVVVADGAQVQAWNASSLRVIRRR